ncbi:MAG: hydrogenase expression/formation protein [Gammaproteobacteria bacterium]|nr:hydrogenase expression/formation protein [Gammaproteobacteria bacterium]
MSGLESIAVRVEGGANTPHRTDNLRPVLIELEQAVRRLVDTGVDSVIDLGAMPFSEQDESDLREVLGSGEVRAELSAFGPSHVEETRFSGVWLVEHLDAEQRRLTLHLQITRFPEILAAPLEDVADGLDELHALNREFPES